MKSFNVIFPIIIVSVFLLLLAFLLLISSRPIDVSKHIRAIGYPKDTIMQCNKELLVVEMHDFVKDTIYFDTIIRNNRMPSTLEEYDPKYNYYRKRK